MYSSDEFKSAKQADVAWSLARIDVKAESLSVYPESPGMPSWSASNTIWTVDNVPVKSLAFLPVPPHPVTDYATVYSAMRNFTTIASQLVQSEIPMYCDESGYCIAREI